MDSYQRFLDLNAGDAALRAEALRRLGDLNLESSESERIERELVTNEGLRATEAIHLYSALLKTYPKYERNDSVLYQLARAYELNAQPDKALASLDRLVAQLSRTAVTSTRRNFGAANCCSRTRPIRRRRRPTRRSSNSAPSSAFYNQSLYKHGWSLFKQGENERSLDSFAGVLDSVLVSKGDPTKLIEIDTLSRAESGVGRGHVPGHVASPSPISDGPKTIDEFVRHRNAAARTTYLLYARLGDLYIEKERYTDAADSYRAFVSQDRNNEKAPLLEMQAIEAYSKGGFPQLVLQGKKEFVENYSYGTAYWQGRDAAGRAQGGGRAQDQSEGRGAVLSRAGAAHQERGRLSGGREMVSQLSDLVPGRSGFRGDQFPAGRHLFESKQYLDAAQEYENTAYHYGGHDKAAAAGYAAIVAYGKEEEALSGEAKAKVHAESIDSSLKFAQTFPAASGKRAGADARRHRICMRRRTMRAPSPPRESLLARAASGRCRQAARRLDGDRQFEFRAGQFRQGGGGLRAARRP